MSERIEKAAKHFYGGIWGIIVKWFRVPEQPPELPVHKGELSESFRPATGFLAYLKFFFWIVLALIDVLLLIAWIAILVASPLVGLLLLPLALVVIVLPDILAYIAIHLRYDTTWYVMTDRSLRIRRGIWVIRETTITFENVQNVSVSQGPLQRYFGIADVLVETAGGGSGRDKHGNEKMNPHCGLIEGIADAPRIRDLILSRLEHSKSAGLGDEPPGRGIPGASWTPAQIEALGEIRDAVRNLLPAAS